MNAMNKILSYIQILVFVCLTVCNGNLMTNPVQGPEPFPCKGHQCGCKTEEACKDHCCCASYENHNEFQDISKKQKNGLYAFISSINCKSGNTLISCVSFSEKYVSTEKALPSQAPLFCFLHRDVSFSPQKHSFLFPRNRRGISYKSPFRQNH